MSVDVLPCEGRSRAAADALSSIRVRGGFRVAFASVGGMSRLSDLHEWGGYRLRFPKSHAAHSEAVIINTAGGVVGGDTVAFDVNVKDHAHAVIATQAAERIYASAAPWSRLDVRLTVEQRARLVWLPQETILFSGARLKRCFEIDVATDGSGLFAEALVFGRRASGERITGGAIHDIWRVRREGRLVLADANRLDAIDETVLSRPAVLGAARAMAFILYVSADAGGLLAPVREVLETARAESGASAWNGALVMRLIAQDPQDMRRDVARLIERITGAPLPRVWSM